MSSSGFQNDVGTRHGRTRAIPRSREEATCGGLEGLRPAVPDRRSERTRPRAIVIARIGPSCGLRAYRDPSQPRSVVGRRARRYVIGEDLTDARYADGHTFAWISVSSTSPKQAQILSSVVLKDGTEDH